MNSSFAATNSVSAISSERQSSPSGQRVEPQGIPGVGTESPKALAVAVTASLNDVLRWVYWWHSTESLPEDVSPQHLRYQLNTDFEAATLGAKELTALVEAWQQGAISRDTLLHNLRAGELLPPARTNEQEVELIGKEPAPVKLPPSVPVGVMGWRAGDDACSTA